ncbi:MAG: ABC transporter ATP-binding protein [Ahrensia sp.]|nr:ABC transporter ATP-binding protein [Ahrensia sp.]
MALVSPSMVASSAPQPTTESAVSGEPVITVDNLHTVFHTQDGDVHAVNGVTFSLRPGELLGVVGESGSGKSVTMMSLLRLLPMPPAEITSGEVHFGGQDLLKLGTNALRDLRGGDVGFIFQDPMTSLNPVFTVGFQLTEPLRIHMGLSKADAMERAVELLELVGIPSARERLKDFPHQFSGGMRQRVMIAIALACDPKLLIADEPTTALDVTVQAQIIELVKELRERLGMAIIWITHDLGVVAGIADRVAVMYGGQIVEYAEVKHLYDDPKHPYTKALLQTLPSHEFAHGDTREERLVSIPGQAPNLKGPLKACPFAPRCEYVHQRCLDENPPMFDVRDGQQSRCWLEDQT